MTMSNDTNYRAIEPNDNDYILADGDFSVGWVHYEIEREEASTWFINGVEATYTRIGWIDRLIFKVVYWWKFTRNEKNMIG